ncbi:MAG: division/cell wall cluster transcriptional repressor MraZ [Lachnospiraceae bacterium]|nr:division/cell wall cluster transcriptional repressor MraZ [Lachnospiraceae bacterium]
MYKGKYVHTIDAKGRLIVPSKFRDQLGDTFVVTKGADGCLNIYDDEGWKAFEETLKEMPMNRKEVRQVARFFLSGAADVEVDKLGRILIPQDLRDYAGLEKDVILTGMADKIEIWSKERFEAASEDQDIADTLEKMADWGIRI